MPVTEQLSAPHTGYTRCMHPPSFSYCCRCSASKFCSKQSRTLRPQAPRLSGPHDPNGPLNLILSPHFSPLDVSHFITFYDVFSPRVLIFSYSIPIFPYTHILPESVVHSHPIQSSTHLPNSFPMHIPQIPLISDPTVPLSPSLHPPVFYSLSFFLSLPTILHH